jgi:hypothetical protein
VLDPIPASQGCPGKQAVSLLEDQELHRMSILAAMLCHCKLMLMLCCYCCCCCKLGFFLAISYSVACISSQTTLQDILAVDLSVALLQKVTTRYSKDLDNLGNNAGAYVADVQRTILESYLMPNHPFTRMISTRSSMTMNS